MSRLSKTASAALAALVVSGAAVLVTLLGPNDAATPVAGPTASPSPFGEASSLPAGVAPGPARPHSVLFVGQSLALRPPGGAERSFACRAAKSLDWHCWVTADVATARARHVKADVVVLVMAEQDDVRVLRARLNALPASLRDARTVILTPLGKPAADAVADALPAVRSMASARGVEVIDPVTQKWLTSSQRRTSLTPDGARPTIAGTALLADRLADALTAVGT